MIQLIRSLLTLWPPFAPDPPRPCHIAAGQIASAGAVAGMTWFAGAVKGQVTP